MDELAGSRWRRPRRPRRPIRSQNLPYKPMKWNPPKPEQLPTATVFFDPFTNAYVIHHPYADAYATQAPKKKGASNSKPERRQTDEAEAKLPSSLCDLPPELLLLVAENLDIEDVFNLVQTCTHIQRALGKYLCGERGQHLLLWASANGKHALAQIALAPGRNVNINFKESRPTALALATENYTNFEGSHRTALALAIENYTPDGFRITKSLRMERTDFTRTTELLLDQPDIDFTDEANGIPILKTAIQRGFGPAVDRLLQLRPDAINAEFDDGCTPLTTAIRRGDADILRLLIDQGADVNQRDHSGRTALAQAIESREPDAAKLLINHGADLTDETNGIPVLQTAIVHGIFPVVERLLQCQDRQARVNTPFNDGQTPLITAANHDREEILDLLLCSGADVNLCGTLTDSGYPRFSWITGVRWTALTVAARRGHVTIIRRLLHCENIRTDIISKASEDTGNSGDAVFWAAVQSHDSCVLALLLSSKVSYSAEQIKTLLAKVRSDARLFRDYSNIYMLLELCEGTNSPKSRQAKLKRWTADKLRAKTVQALLRETDGIGY